MGPTHVGYPRVLEQPSVIWGSKMKQQMKLIELDLEYKSLSCLWKASDLISPLYPTIALLVFKARSHQHVSVRVLFIARLYLMSGVYFLDYRLVIT